MIKVEQVNKTFVVKKRGIQALQEINLSIEAGEIFGIIGHSGAGKSTLIRCLNLLERPTTGTVSIDGVELTNLRGKALRTARKKIGMIFQHFNLMPSRSVLQNVTFALRNVKLRLQEKDKKAKELLELVGLSHRIHAYPANLSGGEKQRVAIARALVNDPKVLLCDEATSALDPETTASILKLLKEVSSKLGITIVLITHSMEVVKEICDRVAIIEGGRIKESGDVLEVFARPKSDIAKQFVAGSNGVEKIYDLLEQKAPVVATGDDEVLLRLTYAGSRAKEPLVYELSSRFDIKTNILFGHIDLIKNETIGNLVVSLTGTKAKRDESIDYLKSHGVDVEVLSA